MTMAASQTVARALQGQGQAWGPLNPIPSPGSSTEALRGGLLSGLEAGAPHAEEPAQRPLRARAFSGSTCWDGWD